MRTNGLECGGRSRRPGQEAAASDSRGEGAAGGRGFANCSSRVTRAVRLHRRRKSHRCVSHCRCALYVEWGHQPCGDGLPSTTTRAHANERPGVRRPQPPPCPGGRSLRFARGACGWRCRGFAWGREAVRLHRRRKSHRCVSGSVAAATLDRAAAAAAALQAVRNTREFRLRHTHGGCHSRQRGCDSREWVCDRPACVCRTPFGVCDRPSGACRTPERVCRSRQRVCRRPTGVCRSALAVCRSRCSRCRTPPGRCRRGQRLSRDWNRRSSGSSSSSSAVNGPSARPSMNCWTMGFVERWNSSGVPCSMIWPL
jgi:hypothetical protein